MERITGTWTFSVTAVNDAPVFAEDTNSLTSISEDETDTSGDQIVDILGDSVTDVDDGAVEGIAIYTSSGNGSWEYSSDQSDWTAVSSVLSAGSILHLTPSHYLRYIPDEKTEKHRGYHFMLGIDLQTLHTPQCLKRLPFLALWWRRYTVQL